MKSASWLIAPLLASSVLAFPLSAFADSASNVLFDPLPILTWQDENASITFSKLTDKFYTNGLRMSWTSPTDAVPDFLGNAFRSVWGADGRQRVAISVQQSIFTPANTNVAIPNPTDRPYAGTLTADVSLLQDTNTTRSIFGVQLGLVGPDAGAEEVQNGFHDIIGVKHANGWAYQVKDEAVGEVLAAREWRLPVGHIGATDIDTVSTLEGAAGNLRVYGLAGSMIRFGQGLTSDFGPSRIRPGLTGTDAFTLTRPLAWYVFAGADAQAVGYDITIDGDTTNSVNKAVRVPLVGEGEVGLSVLYAGLRISYTQVFQTEEVRHQQGGLHEFGSLSIAAHF